MGASRQSSEEVAVAVVMQSGEPLRSGASEENNRVFVAKIPGFTAATAERDLSALMESAKNNPHLKANVEINDNAPDVGATFCAAVVSGNEVHNVSVGSTHCVLVTVNQEGEVAFRLLNEPRHAEFVGFDSPQASYHTAIIEAKEGEKNYVLLLSDSIIGPKTAPPIKDDYVSRVLDELQRESNLLPKQYGLERIRHLIQAKTKYQVASGGTVTEESIVAPFSMPGISYEDRSSTALAIRVDLSRQTARMVVAADGVGGPDVAEALVAALPAQLNQVYSAESVSVVELTDAVPEEQVHGKEKYDDAPDSSPDESQEIARTTRAEATSFISSRSTLFKRADHQVLQYPGYMPLQDSYFSDSGLTYSYEDLRRKHRYLDAVLMVLDEMVTNPNRESQENERLLILILHSMDSESRRAFIDAARAEAEQLMRGRDVYCIQQLEHFASRDALKQMAQEVNLEQEGPQDVVDVGVVDFDFFRDLPGKDEASVNRQALQAEVVELVKAIAWRLDDDGDLDDVLFDEKILEAHMQLLEDALHIIPRKERATFMDEVRSGFSDNPDIGRLQVAVLETAADRIKRGSLAVKIADVRKHADEAETAFYSREENKSTLSGLVKMQLELAQQEFGVEYGKTDKMNKKY